MEKCKTRDVESENQLEKKENKKKHKEVIKFALSTFFIFSFSLFR